MSQGYCEKNVKQRLEKSWALLGAAGAIEALVATLPLPTQLPAQVCREGSNIGSHWSLTVCHREGLTQDPFFPIKNGCRAKNSK